MGNEEEIAEKKMEASEERKGKTGGVGGNNRGNGKLWRI